MIVRANARSWLRLAVIPLALAWPGRLLAQHTEVPPPAAYALQGVTVVHADGRRSEGVTIVVRGHFIEALAAGAAVPADAKILAGDSLLVYPGLIDAQGNAKYEFPKIDIDRAQVASWDPPRAAQGFMPHRRVVDFLQATGADLKDQRKKGVVAAAVYPVDGLMPGRGSLIFFRQSATTPAALVQTPVLGPVLTLRGGMGYPSTLFGVLAFYRQTFEDAGHLRLISNEYARDPRQLTPPAYDPDFEVVQELIGGKVPAFFAVQSAEDIRRVINLSEQYRLQPVIVGGEEAWKVAGLLKARDIPVLLSLDFPKAQYWKPDEGEKDGAKPLDPAELREKKRLEEIYANAAKLSESGVRFTLTSGGGKADLREGARKAIEYGLSEAAALRALTTTPAEFFGIPQAARIEIGRPATFVVANGPLFGKDTRIVYTFVEGELEQGEAPRRSAAGGAAAGSAAVLLSGNWSADLESDAGSTGGSMSITQSGSTFTGSIRGTEIGDMSIVKGTITGNQIEFTLSIQFGGEAMEIPFKGTVDGSSITATGSSPMGEVSLRAQRSGGRGGER
jgi:hypothetical protein